MDKLTPHAFKVEKDCTLKSCSQDHTVNTIKRIVLYNVIMNITNSKCVN